MLGVQLIGTLIVAALIAAGIAYYLWPKRAEGYVCKVCFATLQPDWSHCRACGAPSYLYCVSCHKPLPPGGTTYCPYCGHKRS